MLKRIKWYQEVPLEPFVYDIKLFDIGNTIQRALMNLPSNCVAVSISKNINDKTALEKVAKTQGIRLFWSKRF